MKESSPKKKHWSDNIWDELKSISETQSALERKVSISFQNLFSDLEDYYSSPSGRGIKNFTTGGTLEYDNRIGEEGDEFVDTTHHEDSSPFYEFSPEFVLHNFSTWLPPQETQQHNPPHHSNIIHNVAKESDKKIKASMKSVNKVDDIEQGFDPTMKKNSDLGSKLSPCQFSKSNTCSRQMHGPVATQETNIIKIDEYKHKIGTSGNNYTSRATSLDRKESSCQVSTDKELDTLSCVDENDNIYTVIKASSPIAVATGHNRSKITESATLDSNIHQSNFNEQSNQKHMSKPQATRSTPLSRSGKHKSCPHRTPPCVNNLPSKSDRVANKECKTCPKKKSFRYNSNLINTLETEVKKSKLALKKTENILFIN
jgi:hypothetical protein